MVKLKYGEKLDDLEYKGYKIIQHKEGYKFTSDAVIFANMIKALPSDRVVDLGTGSGIIAILIAAKTRAKEIVGIEIQQRLCDMAQRSITYNKLGARVKVINKPLQNIHKLIGSNFDIVVSNPPYDNKEDKEHPTEIDICRREYKTNLQEVIHSATNLLKFGGRLYIINKAERLAEIIYNMIQNNLAPKNIIMVQPKPNKKADTIIVEAKKGAKPILNTLRSLVLYNDDGTLTQEARRIYGKEE